MKFREARLSDISAICDVRNTVLENRLADPASVTPEMCAAYLTEIGKGWVCEINGEIVGFSIACSKDSSVWALFVRPEFEGRRIGQTLLNLAVEWLFSMGSHRIVLSTDPGTAASAARTCAEGFYTAQGWDRGDIRPNGEVTFLYSKQRSTRNQ